MVAIFIKRHKSMIRVSIFFFCIGCGIALCFLRIDCANAVNTVTPVSARQGATNGIEYAVLVLTSPLNEERRNVIRSTWANFVSNIFVENGERLYKWNHSWTEKRRNHDFIKVYFVVGTKGLSNEKLNMLKTESTRSNDMVLLDNLTDKYENLAMKMKLSFIWFYENIQNLKYIIKCDDDSFVRVDLIVKDLEAFAPQMNSYTLNTYISSQVKTGTTQYQGLYWGYFNGHARVQLKGKWQEQDWFLCDNYLPYALGGGYVISRNIIDFIAKNADLLSSYRSEDISMGVWTAPLDGINRVHDLRFDTEWTSRGCLNHMLVRHKQTTQDMFQMYKALVDSKGENLCKTETIERGAYAYKWNSRPSQCCNSLHHLFNRKKENIPGNMKT
ncbi:beta-1,3-galactosyltransferase 6 [Cydia pomonella]|uniref:beta-1,3-galactosyltransferase 6 n=1 Tax=Cydia pomonella TaxID=82600 RepID=UPI002ADDF497|nr:beta-1,3-galactosyltransferase 6 [Cydia pomonella]